MSSSFRASTIGFVLVSLCLTGSGASAATSLRGSQSSILRQYHAAQALNLSPVRNSKELNRFVELGLLVEVPGGADYELDGVSYPYTRPATRAVLEKLAREYRAATGERLVVTSLTRPLSRQPRNASRYSVHPMGIAADIRRPQTPQARKWLEGKLRTLETEGVVEATHERRPPHYHVAVFPNHAETYAGGEAPARDLNPDPPSPVVQAMSELPPSTPEPYMTYTIRRGDTLWTIAQRYETSVARLRKLNGLGSSTLHPGQKLMVPQGNWE